MRWRREATLAPAPVGHEVCPNPIASHGTQEQKMEASKTYRIVSATLAAGAVLAVAACASGGNGANPDANANATPASSTSATNTPMASSTSSTMNSTPSTSASADASTTAPAPATNQANDEPLPPKADRN